MSQGPSKFRMDQITGLEAPEAGGVWEGPRGPPAICCFESASQKILPVAENGRSLLASLVPSRCPGEIQMPPIPRRPPWCPALTLASSTMRLGPISPPSMVVFSLLLEAISAKPFVHLLYTDDSACLEFKAIPACFGVPLPRAGLAGQLVEAVPENACRPVGVPPASNRTPAGFILLIRRYDCGIGTKVLHAQQAGYQAALIHNLYSDLLASTATERPERWKLIRIPSLLIGGTASNLLRRRLHSGKAIHVDAVIPRDYEDPCWDKMDYTVLDDTTRRRFRFWPGYCTQRMVVKVLEEFSFLIFLGLFLSLAFAGWMKWRRGGSRARVRTFRTGDPDDLCVICMAEYEAGDQLKVLPCAHAYHNTCIDTWLFLQPKAGKTCPICKQKVWGSN